MCLPKISIITPSFNQAAFLEETVLSVLNQNYPSLEYMVIDGGSTDGSVEIIKRYESHLAYWESKPDRGQVHALNKGLEMMTGDIFAFINSDDVYLPGAFSAVVNYFQSNPDCEWLCGDTLFFGEGHRTKLFQAVTPKSAAHALAWQAHCPQPGMFWRRELLASGFDERWRYCFDHDLYVRLLLQGYKCEHLPLPVGGYRLHKDSKTVAESQAFDDEFDRIAEHYEPMLRGAGRRWSKATRFLRKSYSAGKSGNVKEGSGWLIRALLLHPEGICSRPFWGCLKMILKGAASW